MKKAEKALSQSRPLSATAAHSGDISPDSDVSSAPHPQIYTAMVLWALNDNISLIIYLSQPSGQYEKQPTCSTCYSRRSFDVFAVEMLNDGLTFFSRFHPDRVIANALLMEY